MLLLRAWIAPKNVLLACLMYAAIFYGYILLQWTHPVFNTVSQQANLGGTLTPRSTSVPKTIYITFIYWWFIGHFYLGCKSFTILETFSVLIRHTSASKWLENCQTTWCRLFHSLLIPILWGCNLHLSELLRGSSLPFLQFFRLKITWQNYRLHSPLLKNSIRTISSLHINYSEKPPVPSMDQ